MILLIGRRRKRRAKSKFVGVSLKKIEQRSVLVPYV